MRTLFVRGSRSEFKVLILIALTLVLMWCDRQYSPFLIVRTALMVPFASLQYTLAWPVQIVDKLAGMVSTQDRLLQENVRLKSDMLLLHAKLQRFIALETQNENLRSLLKASQELNTKTTIAELLAIGSEPFVHHVVINKGSRDHVYGGQAVLDASGVMGQVIQVGLTTSRVMLIHDPKSGIAVQNVRNGMRAVAVGDGYSHHLKLLYVANTADIRPGDLFMTSGLGEHYPEGYPVGQVLSFKNNPSAQFAEVILKPSAKLENSREVLLVGKKPHA